MIHLLIALFMGLATPATIHSAPVPLGRHIVHAHTDDCPYGVYNCACTYDNYTGGDKGHISVVGRPE